MRAAQALAADARREADAVDAQWARHARAAKGALGVWSDVGVTEARKEFWCAHTAPRRQRRHSGRALVHSHPRTRLQTVRRSYEGGKVFAQRHTFYDVLFALISGRNEENAFSFVLRCRGRRMCRICAACVR